MAYGMLRERPIEFPGPVGLLEGRIGDGFPVKKGAVVVLHPHPLYGGSMHNNVVETTVRAAQRASLMTLRFNFRGVSNSQGTYDNGVGEQDDVRAALDFLEEDYHPKALALVGYSFGACIALGYCHRPRHGVDHLILVSPPPFLLSDNLSLEVDVMRKIFLGERDEIAPPEQVMLRISSTKGEQLVEVMPGADHFFGGKEEDLQERLLRILKEYCS